MKLTKRGKRLRALLIIAPLLWAVWFFSTHHRVLVNCHPTIEGRVCDLGGYERNSK